MTIVIALLAGLLGVLVGGVVNALADDLPFRENPSWPHFPNGTPRPMSAWLGVTAFLTGQRGTLEADAPAPESAEVAVSEIAEAVSLESADEPGPGDASADSAAEPEPGDEEDEEYFPVRPASGRLGWRHPLVEIGVGLAFAALVLAFPHEKNLWAWLVYVGIMTLITVIDMEHRLILFVVIVPSCLFALLVAAVSPPNDKSFSEFLVGGAVGFVVFFAMFIGGGVFAMAAGYEGVAFGFGDVMLATLSGLILGWRAFIFAALLTVFIGAAGSLLYMTGRAMVGQRHRWFTPLPYGPYIVLGTLIMLFFREEVQEFLIGTAY